MFKKYILPCLIGLLSASAVYGAIFTIEGNIISKQDPMLGERTSNFWDTVGTYLKTTNPSGYDILINGTSKYLNFNALSGTSGYGLRDSSGTMQWKNSGGDWANIGSGGGTNDFGTFLNNYGQVMLTTSSTYPVWIRGNTAVSGTLYATAFSGNGSGLTGIVANGASSTLLSDNNNFTGTNSFTSLSANLYTGSIATSTWYGNVATSTWPSMTIGGVVLPELFTNTTEPTGFMDRSSVLAWDNATYTFSITGSHDIYINGVKTTKGNGTKQIADTTGNHWIYYDANGTLSESTTEPSFSIPFVATVYWNTVTNIGILGDERHGIKMDADTHHVLHRTVGTRYESGLTATIDNTTISMTAGKIDDEDLEHSLAATTTVDIFYKDGSADFKALQGQTKYYYEDGGSDINYNNGNTLTAVPVNLYVAYWIFATNAVSSSPIVALMGQRTDVTRQDARDNNKYESLTLGTLPFQEMKLLYRVILRNDATPYEETQDLRAISNLPAGTFIATQHNSLTGLNWSQAGHTFDTLLQLGAYGASGTSFTALNGMNIGRTATTTIYGSTTSTFGAGIQSTGLNITSNSVTSTFANGIDLSKGCFAIGGVCLTVGAGSGDAIIANGIGQFPNNTAYITATSSETLSGKTWQGTAIANGYVADDLTISGGTVNNSIIGGSTPAAGTFTTLSANLYTGAISTSTINGTTIGASTPSTGAFTSLSANLFTGSIATSTFPSLTVTGTFTLPNSLDPTLSATGTMAFNDTMASTSLRYFDNGEERALRPYTEGGLPYASSTLAYMGAYGAAGTSTISILFPYSPKRLKAVGCITDVGTAHVQFSTSTSVTKTPTLKCTTAGVWQLTGITNNLWQMGETVKINIGSQISNPNQILVTPVFENMPD